jgi:predicted AlkP superfamily pyrophosphatase or phosphodiesterase
MKIRDTISLLVTVAMLWAGAGVRAAGVKGIEHVVIIGCDGMSPDGVRKANAPVMKEMMREGAFTLHARGVMPTSSSPNWASMIMGAGPEQHGVTSNDWETNKYEIEPVARGTGGMFPTIFGVLRQQRPDAIIACFHDWDGFGRLFERQALDMIENPKGPTNTALRAIQYLREKTPTFTFIHFDHVDHAGHQYGHGTPEYYAAVGVADKLIGTIREAIRESGQAESTIVLVTADHGGVGKSHGNATMAELEIPWILTGPGVKRGHEIVTPINTYDTAVTVAYILGIKPHPAWIGKPIVEAFAR